MASVSHPGCLCHGSGTGSNKIAPNSGVTSSLWRSNLDDQLELHGYMELGTQPSQLARDVRMNLKSNLCVLKEKILKFKHITMTWGMSSGRQVVVVGVKLWSLLTWWLCWRTQFKHWQTSHSLQCLHWRTWDSHRVRTIPRKPHFMWLANS